MQRARRTRDGVVSTRRARQARDERGFRKCELGDRFAEVAARGGFNAVGALAEIDRIEVSLEDLAFRERVFDFPSDAHFSELAAKRLLGDREQLGIRRACELHGNRRETLGGAMQKDVLEHRPADAHIVDAVMLVEPSVLSRENGGAERLGNLFERERPAIFVEKARDLDPVAVRHDRGSRGFLAHDSMQIEAGRSAHAPVLNRDIPGEYRRCRADENG